MSRYVALTVLLVLGACATDRPERPEEPGARVDRFWPEAPAEKRIEFLSLFADAKDLDLRESFFRRMRDAFAGGDERGLSRPYAIAVRGDLVAVADPGAAAVHLFDQSRKSYRRLGAAGEQAFETPIGVALGDERLFVADSGAGKVYFLDHRLRMLLTVEGLQRPTGLAYDPVRQRLYVADTLAHSVHVFDRDGRPLFTIGERGEQDYQFNYPSHLAFSGDRLFVNDTMNFRIQIFDPEGRHLRTFGKHGDGSGYFTQPKGVAVDSDGHIYVADALSNQIQIFDDNGLFLLGFGDSGEAPGSFQMPTGLAIWEDLIYVADSHNQRVQVFRYLPKSH